MPTYEKADEAVRDMAQTILQQFETHAPVLTAGVRIDFLFAFADLDAKTGLPKNDAITHRGRRALGLCRKIKVKDRVKGMGDAEITLDGDWWVTVDDEERRALLDHELHHIAVIEGEKDKAGRPKLALREHDVEFGWFTVIAARHGLHSQERKQAAQIMEMHGQFYFPELVKATGGRTSKLEMSQRAA